MHGVLWSGGGATNWVGQQRSTEHEGLVVHASDGWGLKKGAWP